MKIIMRIVNVFLIVASLSLLISWDNSPTADLAGSGIGPFSNGGDEANLIVVISDLHLGANPAYSECVANLGPLDTLLNQIRVAKNVKELVIAGDLFDEWFIPATTDTYQGKDQADFVKRIAENNKVVFDDLNNIIQDGKILVTYVPGNHDLAIRAANIDSVLPGINQARDEMLGLGTYSPVDCPKIAIEHGHRYNFFCAPDPISNQDLAAGTILPPGYFFTRIAVLWVVQKFPRTEDTIPNITPDTAEDISQDLLFRYWKDWALTLKLFPVQDKFDEKIIVTNINGFKGTYSINDLLPYQSSPGGEIDVKLYKGIQDNWDTRQSINKVAVHIDTKRAIDSVMAVSEIDRQAGLQYFSNPKSDKRIVVFGHTHVAKIIPSNNNKEQKSIYANSGTWIDNNNGLKTRTFVVITPQDPDNASLTYVRLYNIENGGLEQMAADSLRY